MTIDIVERMKNYIHGEHDEYIPEVLQLACAEIERLRGSAASPPLEPTSEMVRRGESAGYQAIGNKLSQVDGRKFANAAYRAMVDMAVSRPAPERPAATPGSTRVAELEQFVSWVETWTANPISAYSVFALDGLFGMTRDRIAALRAKT